MSTFVMTIIFAPSLMLIIARFLPAGLFSQQPDRRINLTTCLVRLNLAAAITALIAVQVSGPSVLSLGSWSAFSATLLFDGLSTTVMALVASITWVICRFSTRYLDGEDRQANFFAWLGFTIASVMLFVLSANLFLTILAFLLISIGIHPLLVHYSDRPAAASSAWLKFGLSRLGDTFLLVAAVLLYRQYGTANLPQLFEAVSQNPDTFACQLSGWLLMLCGLTKSAQFPFHTWLPDTMEAPTPVSALMHAGIVNGGGYLLIRLAPIVSFAPQAMVALAVIGTITACFASLCMLPQTSVKKKLAWSTIAQMGFMMLQCGLMAWTAALLHIVAHSFYKAHAFLNSGSVLNDAEAMTTARHPSKPVQLIPLAAAVAIVAGIFVLQSQATGLSFHAKPGSWLLGLILCAGISRWVSGLLQQGLKTSLLGIVGASVLLGTYQLSFMAISALIRNVNLPSNLDGQMLLYVSGIFFAILLLTEVIVSGSRKGHPRLKALRIHAVHGFYFDALLKRPSLLLAKKS